MAAGIFGGLVVLGGIDYGTLARPREEVENNGEAEEILVRRSARRQQPPVVAPQMLCGGDEAQVTAACGPGWANPWRWSPFE